MKAILLRPVTSRIASRFTGVGFFKFLTAVMVNLLTISHCHFRICDSANVLIELSLSLRKLTALHRTAGQNASIDATVIQNAQELN